MSFPLHHHNGPFHHRDLPRSAAPMLVLAPLRPPSMSPPDPQHPPSPSPSPPPPPPVPAERALTLSDCSDLSVSNHDDRHRIPHVYPPFPHRYHVTHQHMQHRYRRQNHHQPHSPPTSPALQHFPLAVSHSAPVSIPAPVPISVPAPTPAPTPTATLATTPHNSQQRGAPGTAVSTRSKTPRAPRKVARARTKMSAKMSVTVRSNDAGPFKPMTPKKVRSSKSNIPGESRYWTPSEHKLFVEALLKYGPKDLKAISAYVGTRNMIQCRTHEQKCFMRLMREAQRETLQRNGRYASDFDERRKLQKDVYSVPASCGISLLCVVSEEMARSLQS